MNVPGLGSVVLGVPLSLRIGRRVEDSVADEAGLRRAWAAQAGQLHGVAVRVVGERDLAEEVVAETFVRAWRSADRFDPELGSLRTWLFAILRNVAIDAARARSSRPPLGPEVVDVGVDDERIDASLRSWLVEEALRRLTEDHRHVVVQTYYRGLPATEVAAALGIPVATVRTRLFYGLKALRLALDELGWNNG